MSSELGSFCLKMGFSFVLDTCVSLRLIVYIYHTIVYTVRIRVLSSTQQRSESPQVALHRWVEGQGTGTGGLAWVQLPEW